LLGYKTNLKYSFTEDMLMEDIKRIIANNIIELRVEAGMKQADLAEKIHYSDKSVSKWERAEAAPDAAVLRNIVRSHR